MSQNKFAKKFVIDNIREHYAPENIEPFSYVFQLGEYISKYSREKFEFFLEVCPKTPNPDFVAVYLNFATNSNQTSNIKPSSIRIRSELSVLNYKGEKCLTNFNRKKLLQTKVETHEFLNKKEENGKKKYVRYLNRKLLLDPQNGLLNGNQLILNCEVDFNETVAPDNKQTQSNLSDLKENTKDSSKDLGQAKSLEETPKVNDVVFEFRDNKKLNGNKAILASKSRVFKEIFDRQSWHKLIKLDESFELFCEVFNFIYNGIVGSTVPEMFVELYNAAIKYEIGELKSYCEDWFCFRINDTTVCQLLIQGDDMKSSKLKSAAISYIAMHKELLQQGDFKDRFKNKEKLFGEMYKAVHNNKN